MRILAVILTITLFSAMLIGCTQKKTLKKETYNITCWEIKNQECNKVNLNMPQCPLDHYKTQTSCKNAKQAKEQPEEPETKTNDTEGMCSTNRECQSFCELIFNQMPGQELDKGICINRTCHCQAVRKF